MSVNKIPCFDLKVANSTRSEILTPLAYNQRQKAVFRNYAWVDEGVNSSLLASSFVPPHQAIFPPFVIILFHKTETEPLVKLASM